MALQTINKPAAVAGNLFEDLVEDVTEFWDDIFTPIERNLLRPIGENLKDLERNARPVIQEVAGIAKNVAQEVGPELALLAAGGTIPPGGLDGRRSPGRRPSPPQGDAGGNDWMWWVLGGLGVVTVGGIVYGMTR